LMNEMPDFFSLETVEYAQEMLDSLQWFVAYEDENLLWFITFGKLKEESAKIYRMAVSKKFQAIWIGTQLFEQAEKELQSEKIATIELITLWDHPDYPGYANTRKFYEKMWCKKISSSMEDDIELLTLGKEL
jgi:GNAT superfamily N-acetyltransferase